MSDPQDTISQEINDAIKKLLPQQVGEVLARELEELKVLRRQVDTAIRNEKNAIRDCEGQRAEVFKLTEQLKKHAAITDREAAVTKRESTQDLRDFEVKMYRERHGEIFNLVGLVFKSPVYRETVTANVPVPVQGNPGGAGYMPTSGFVSVHQETKITERTSD